MFNGINILIADDSLQTLEMLRFIFESEGASVITATNGQQAYEKAVECSFDVILMDIQMPICDGIAATAKIREVGIDTTIIAVTAAPEIEAKDYLSRGFSDYYLKPVDFEKLSEKVLYHLRASKEANG